MVSILVPVDTTPFPQIALVWLKTQEDSLLEKSLSQTLEAESKVVVKRDVSEFNLTVHLSYLD